MNEESIFTAALEKPADARAAYLANVCANDEPMRKRVEELLAASEKVGNFMSSPVAARVLDSTTTQAAPADGNAKAAHAEEESFVFLTPSSRPDSLGRIGHYEVLEVLGKGGFGIVFRAFDVTLQRIVAVKVLAADLAATSPARKRFLREARSSAQVRHENVVQVYEIGEQPLPYLAMEFIPGETLQQRLDRTGPLDALEVVRIGRQIAEGLAAAHATDLVHRDIKPSNILLEGGQEKVKLTDFGLARAADDASISQSGIIAGTPMYMAPEQALGNKLDQRADLFSLGSVLYQMVAGRPPFRANSTVAVLKRVAEDRPRDIREIIPETPLWLCKIIARLHEKKPADRYQSAREIAEVLADCEQQLKTHGVLKDFSRIPGGKPRRPQRAKLAAVAAVLLLPVFALAVTEIGGVTRLFRSRQTATDPIKLDLGPIVANSPPVPKNEAEVLNYLLGNWKIERREINPRVPSKAGPAHAAGETTYDWVASGKLLRCRVGLANLEFGQPLALYAFDAKTNSLRRWFFWSGGRTLGPIPGVFNPSSRALLWTHNVGDDTHSHINFDFDDPNNMRAQLYRQDAENKLVCDAHLIFTRTNESVAPAKLPIDPNRPAEMKVLDRLAGEWRSELKVENLTLPERVKNETVRTHAELILGGRYLEMIEDNESTGSNDYTIIWFDEARREYRQWVYLGVGYLVELSGTWNDDTRTMNWTSADGFLQGTWDFKNDGRREFRHFIHRADGKVVSETSGVARRVPPALPDTAEQVLPALAGAWKGEYTQKIYGGKPAEKKQKALAINDWIVGQKWLRQQVQIENEGFQSVTTYEPSSKSFRDWFFHSRGLIFGPSTGRWDPATRTMTWTNLPEAGIVLLMSVHFADADTLTGEILIRDKDGKTLFELTSLMKRTTEKIVIDEAATTAQLPPEMAVLDRLVGAWQTNGVIRDAKNPGGLNVLWKTVGCKILGGRVIATSQDGPGRDKEMYALSSFDSFSNAFGRWLFRSDGSVTEYGGGWDEKTQTLKWHWAGKDGSQSSNTWRYPESNRIDWQVLTRDALGKTTFEVQAVSIRQHEPTFVPLFNGMNLTGWKGAPAHPGPWSVKDGVLRGSGATSLLVNEKEYADFHLRAVLRISDGGDSGIFFRCDQPPLENNAPRGYEALINATIQNMPRTGSLEDTLANHQIGKDPLVKPNEWFTYEIIAKGNHIELKVNGQTTLSWTDHNKQRARGYLALQIANANTVVEFRKIEIQEFPQTPLAVPKAPAEVLPFLAGNWKIERHIVVPMAAPELVHAGGYATFDYVGDKRFLRGHLTFDRGLREAHVLHSFDAANGRHTSWFLASDGQVNGPGVGMFDAEQHTILWLEKLPNGAHSAQHFEFTDSNHIKSRVYHQDQENKIVFEMRMTFSRILGPIAYSIPPIDPSRPREMKVLDRLLGEWRDELTVKSAATRGTDKAETVMVRAAPILGGRFIELHETNETKKTSDYWLAWFDQDRKQFRTWYFAHDGSFGEPETTWNEEKKTMTWMSDDGTIEGRYVFKSDDQREVTYVVRDEDGKILNEAKGVSRRAKSPPP